MIFKSWYSNDVYINSIIYMISVYNNHTKISMQTTKRYFLSKHSSLQNSLYDYTKTMTHFVNLLHQLCKVNFWHLKSLFLISFKHLTPFWLLMLLMFDLNGGLKEQLCYQLLFWIIVTVLLFTVFIGPFYLLYTSAVHLVRTSAYDNIACINNQFGKIHANLYYPFFFYKRSCLVQLFFLNYYSISHLPTEIH